MYMSGVMIGLIVIIIQAVRPITQLDLIAGLAVSGAVAFGATKPASAELLFVATATRTTVATS